MKDAASMVKKRSWRQTDQAAEIVDEVGLVGETAFGGDRGPTNLGGRHGVHC